MKRLAALLVLVLASGCGLPLDNGVQVPRQVEPGTQPRRDIQVLPPGPRDENGPEEVVRGFFGAQSNPDDRHARAREFLTTELRATWDDAGPVSVFDGQSGLTATMVDERPDLFLVTARRVGSIARDGSYTPASGTISIRVRLSHTGGKRWELSDVPPGLVLSTADRDRSFRWRSVYFLAPSTGQSADAPTHLVPDPVYIPITSDPAQALVERLLAGPSLPTGDSVETAVPDDTTLLTPVNTSPTGVITVDLSKQVADAPDQQREQLSAQLVWTLRGIEPGFSALRLRSGGRDLRVNGSGDAGVLQDRTAWQAYDPDGLTTRAAAYYISGRRLRSLDAGLTSGPASDDENQQLVDVAAVAPRGVTLALLTTERSRWVLRTGPVSGPFDVRSRGPALASPSWGSGDLGVWFVSSGRVMLAPPTGAAVGVPVDGIGAYGRVSQLRVSRDGARVAMVAGEGAKARLVVGRVRVAAGQVRVVALRAIAPAVREIRDLTWDSATSLVVLGRVTGPAAPLPVRIAVDGSAVTALTGVGLEGSAPVSLSGAPGRPLVVAATSGRRSSLFRYVNRRYSMEARGYAPFYPG